MKTETARFDSRIPKEQKEYFEFAASLGGYRTLTDFVISSAQSKADEIVQRHRTFLASKKDQKTFFEAVLNPAPPAKKLISAARKHAKLSGRK